MHVCGMDKIETFAPKGILGFVLGTILLFGKDRPYGEILRGCRIDTGKVREYSE